MAQLPADRTKLALAQENQVPSMVAAAARNINAITELYDTVDLLNQKVDTFMASPTLPFPDESVTTPKLANGAVTEQKLANNAVTPQKIPNGSLTFDKFVPSALMNETQNALRITELEEEVDEHKADEANNRNNINSKFISRLFSGLVTKIKLIGDSITVGNGARNYTPPSSSNPVIFDDGQGTVHYEGNTNVSCWANYFRNFIASNFPAVQFTNAGIGGASAKFANANKQYWVSETEDVVFVMLGTNDRWDCADPDEFKANLEEFLSYVDSRSNLMIVMTASPTRNDSNPTYHFGMNKVDRVITEVCQRKGYIHISHYRELLRRTETGDIIPTLVEHEGSHPNNEGYMSMWKIIQQRLGFIDPANWENGNISSLWTVWSGSQFPYVVSTTPITFFPTGKRVVIETNNNSDKENFPEQQYGWLTTVRGVSNDLYSYQTYEPREGYNTYKRTWNFGSSVWNPWRKIPTIQQEGSSDLVVGTVSANTIKEIEVIVSNLNTYTFASSVFGTIPTGIIFSIHVDAAANRVRVRFLNTTGASIDVGTLTLKYTQYR